MKQETELTKENEVKKDPEQKMERTKKDEVKKDPESPTFLQNLKAYVREWSENTSLHGVRYMGERKRNVYEKLWWLTLFAVSLYLCIDLILRTYQKWDTSPVIVSFAQSPTPVWQIPFPAVTICPEIKSKQSVYNFSQKFLSFYGRNGTDITYEEQEDWDKYQDISLVCDYDLMTEENQYADNNTIDLITQVAPEFNEIFHSCNWTDKNENCKQLFTPVLTEEGVCYTFNMLNRKDIFKDVAFHIEDYPILDNNKDGWSLEKGYSNKAGKNTFPRRAMSAGTKAGLTLTMTAKKLDLDYACKGPVQGFKILLHHPGQAPIVSTQYFRAPLNQEVIVSLKPDMMNTSDNVRSYPSHRRQCYFSAERALMFYKDYTQKNCEVECLTNYTWKKCGCVAYHMPHKGATKICGTGNTRCIREAVGELLSEEVQRGIKRDAFKHLEEDGGCNCLPACTSLTYNAETSFVSFNWIEMFNALKINTTDFSELKFTRVTIFFKDMQFITSERNELYGRTDFIANCGGLLGLFIGFSFLSIVETIYFLTFRLLCNIRRHGRYFWSGSPDLLNTDA